jgi:hypothetical protein
MKKILATAILLALSGSALAGGIDVNASSGSASQSQSQSGSISGSVSSSGAATSGNAQNLSVSAPDSIKYRGGYDVRNVPDVTLIPPGMTAPCMVSVGASGSGVGFGIGIAGGLEDKECTRRETARTLVSLGKTDAAIRLFCNNPEVAKLLAECAAPAPLPAKSGAQVSYNPTTRVTTVRELNGFNH